MRFTVSISHVSSYAASVLEAFFDGRSFGGLAFVLLCYIPMHASILLRIGRIA